MWSHYPGFPEKKGTTQMLKHMVRWIVILATLLIIATALVLSPAFDSHASGVHTTKSATATPTATSTPSGGVMTPDYGWAH